jgi:hypothetical protein
LAEYIDKCAYSEDDENKLFHGFWFVYSFDTGRKGMLQNPGNFFSCHSERSVAGVKNLLSVSDYFNTEKQRQRSFTEELQNL